MTKAEALRKDHTQIWEELADLRAQHVQVFEDMKLGVWSKDQFCDKVNCLMHAEKMLGRRNKSGQSLDVEHEACNTM